MYRYVILVVAVFLSAGISASPICDQQAPAKCTQPALEFFLQRFGERKAEEITDAKWAKDMLQQCELDQKGSECLIEFMQKCFPAKPVTESPNINKKAQPSCQEKVTSLTTGCAANTSVWHKACENPLVEQLHASLTMTPSNTPSESALRQIHSQICCQIYSYKACVGEKAKAECKEGAITTFQDMFNGLHAAYQCDPSASFKDNKC